MWIIKNWKPVSTFEWHQSWRWWHAWQKTLQNTVYYIFLTKCFCACAKDASSVIYNDINCSTITSMHFKAEHESQFLNLLNIFNFNFLFLTLFINVKYWKQCLKFLTRLSKFLTSCFNFIIFIIKSGNLSMDQVAHSSTDFLQVCLLMAKTAMLVVEQWTPNWQ